MRVRRFKGLKVQKFKGSKVLLREETECITARSCVLKGGIDRKWNQIKRIVKEDQDPGRKDVPSVEEEPIKLKTFFRE